MSKDEEIIESLVLGGIVGAVLGALISNKKDGSGALTGALAGAAILGTFKANERAQKSNTPILVEEDNVIYEINSKGEKKIFKEIPRSGKIVPRNYKLK